MTGAATRAAAAVKIPASPGIRYDTRLAALSVLGAGLGIGVMALLTAVAVRFTVGRLIGGGPVA